MLKQVKFRAPYLMQWNARRCKDNTKPEVDKVVEAVMHSQGIPFEHTSEYRNIYSYDKLWEQLEHYDSEYRASLDNPNIKAGLRRSFKIFAKPFGEDYLETVNLVSASAALFSELGLKEDKAAGLTAYGQTKIEAFGVGVDKAAKILKEGKSPSPCLAGVRTQRKGKTRLVWGYPLEMTILEAIIAKPLLSYLKCHNNLMSYGKTSHEIGMRLRRSCSTTKYHASIDYSQFDSTVHPKMIRYAFSAFRTYFDLTVEVYQGVTLATLFDIVEQYFIHTPIVMPNRDKNEPTLVLGKCGGVPSGSYFTQLVDSFVNAALIFSVSERFQLSLKEENVYVLGDDCLFFCNQEIDLCKLSSFVSAFGYKCNPAKGSSGTSNQSIEYLGRKWKNGFPLRPYSDVTRGALYPEKYRRYSDNRAQREQQALALINSYLLTSYVEDSPIGCRPFSEVNLTGMMTSGYMEFLLKEGFVPGKILKRAIY